MNKRILISLSVIAAVAAIAIGGTVAYFSDTETSTGNTFTAGVIDISVDGQNPWAKTYTLADMKPSQTDYINFTIENKGSGANPVNVWKKIYNVSESDNIVSEPECTENGGTWTTNPNNPCTGNYTAKNNISTVIDYDLSVKVYNASGTEIWGQTIYNKDVTVEQIKNNPIFLGMVPANGSMKVTQSYHMKADTTNWAQGDKMTFDIEVKGEQLKGSLVLENKSGDPDWRILGGDGIQGNLAYNVKGPKFDYTFSASGLKTYTGYRLIYYADPWAGNHPGALIASFTTDGSGNIATTSGSVELGMDLPTIGDANYPAGAKIWLVTASDYNYGSASVGPMTDWNPADYLFETALITYDDTDL